MAFEHKRSSEMEFRDAPNVVLFQIPRLQSLVRFVIITTKREMYSRKRGHKQTGAGSCRPPRPDILSLR